MRRIASGKAGATIHAVQSIGPRRRRRGQYGHRLGCVQAIGGADGGRPRCEKHSRGIRIRVGICTGSVIAGVIGREKFAYDLWSETVNLACHLESTAEIGKIQISESTCDRLKE